MLDCSIPKIFSIAWENIKSNEVSNKEELSSEVRSGRYLREKEVVLCRGEGRMWDTAVSSVSGTMSRISASSLLRSSLLKMYSLMCNSFLKMPVSHLSSSFSGRTEDPLFDYAVTIFSMECFSGYFYFTLWFPSKIIFKAKQAFRTYICSEPVRFEFGCKMTKLPYPLTVAPERRHTFQHFY